MCCAHGDWLMQMYLGNITCVSYGRCIIFGFVVLVAGALSRRSFIVHKSCQEIEKRGAHILLCALALALMVCRWRVKLLSDSYG